MTSFVLLSALLVLALLVRLLALDVDGHLGDVRVMAAWAERMAAVGPWHFYDAATSIYPTLLYPLGALGVALDGEQLRDAIKGLSIPFDLAIGVVLFAYGRSRSRRWAAAVASLYLFNPAVILAGPAWGQVDSAGTLPYLAALLASAARRDGLAGGLAAVAGLVKPQYGLVALPVLAVAILRSRQGRERRPVLHATLGLLGGYLLVAAPLALHPPRYLGLLESAATLQPRTSLNAFNPWGLLVGFDRPDDGYVVIGAILLLLGLAAALLALRRGNGAATLLGVGALIVLAFYFLPTRVHERYLFPAMAVLAPFAAGSVPGFLAYLALSLGFAASLLFALHETTPFVLPDPIASVLTSTTGIWAIGLVLMASAAAWVWLVGVRCPRLPARRGDR